MAHLLQVTEQPGSYFWHDHSASNRADGLQGALVVLPSAPEIAQYDAEETLFITDWFHGKYLGLSPPTPRHPFSTLLEAALSPRQAWG